MLHRSHAGYGHDAGRPPTPTDASCILVVYRGAPDDGVWGIDAQRFVDVANGGDSTALDAELIAGAQALGAGRPSLLQNLIRDRPAKIDALKGWVADRGQDVEIPTPCNAAITEVVRSFPVGTLRLDPANLQKVLARLG